MQAQHTDIQSAADAIARRAVQAMKEAQEPYALSDALHVRTTRKKTAHARGYEQGKIDGLSEALFQMRWRDARTPFEVRMFLMEEAER